MIENETDAEYLAWLRSLKRGDVVAIVTPFSVESGVVQDVVEDYGSEIQLGWKVSLLVVKADGPIQAVYTFYDDKGYNQPHEARICPLTDERRLALENARRIAKKAAKLTIINWQHTPEYVLDAMLVAYETAGGNTPKLIPVFPEEGTQHDTATVIPVKTEREEH